MWWRTDARLVVLVVAAFAARAGAVQSQRELTQLGRVDPPAYAAPLVRSADASEVFEAAMAAYGRREFDAAAALLRRVVVAEPDEPAANFFLGVSLMMIDEVGEAEDRLAAVLAMEASPFTAAARFVRAKALIRLGRLDAAERELLVVGKTDSPYSRAAEDLLPKVRAIRGRR